MYQLAKIAVFSALVCVLSLTFPTAASAQDSGTQYKIAVADLKVLLRDYSKRERLYAELQKEVDKRQVELDALSKKIEDAKAKFEESSASMSEEDRFNRKNEIESEFLSYQNKLKTHQNYIDNQEEKVLKEVVQDIQAAIEKIGEQENYHLILNSAKGPQGSVLYNSPTIDITSKVLAVLDAADKGN